MKFNKPVDEVVKDLNDYLDSMDDMLATLENMVEGSNSVMKTSSKAVYEVYKTYNTFPSIPVFKVRAMLKDLSTTFIVEHDPDIVLAIRALLTGEPLVYRPNYILTCKLPSKLLQARKILGKIDTIEVKDEHDLPRNTNMTLFSEEQANKIIEEYPALTKTPADAEDEINWEEEVYVEGAYGLNELAKLVSNNED